MKQTIAGILIIGLAVLLMASQLGSPLVALYYPTTDKVLTSTSRHYIVGEIDTLRVRYLELSRDIERIDTMKVNPATLQDDFVKTIKRLFDKNYQVTMFSVTVRPSNMKRKPITHRIVFPPQERMDLRKFSQTKEFLNIYERCIQDTAVLYLAFHFQGKQGHLVDLKRGDRLEKMGSIFIQRIELQYGQNDYLLRLLDNQQNIQAEKPFSYLYKPPLDAVLEEDPNYQRIKFHTADQEQQCTDCHRMEPTETERSDPSAVIRMCYPCHAWVTVGVSVHPTIPDWTCFQCHTPPSEGKSGYPVPPKKVSAEVCYECHSDLQDLVNSAQVKHAPFESGDCVSCHDVHSSSQPSLLTAKVVTLCLYCHEQKYAKDHPVLRHPVDGRRDPLNPKKNFSCVSCHNPHASNHIKLFNRVSARMQLCQECHKK